jgi:hypothetical protein
LNLDFTLGTLDDRITFTRATTATYFDKDGVLTSAASGEARFDYDPSTLAPRGLLIEEQRANLFQRSEEFDNAYWTKTRSSITADTIVAPNGTLTGDKLVEDTSASASHPLVSSGVSISVGAVISFSVFAKAAERTALVLRVNNASDSIWCAFNLSTGVVGTAANSGTGSGATGSIVNVGNGWYRCTLSGIASSTAASVQAIMYPAVSTTDPTNTSIIYTGDGTSGIFIWGAQLEAGAFATSYIPTTTTALTRNADAASMTGTNFSDWYNAAEGTFYIDWVRDTTSGTATGGGSSVPRIFATGTSGTGVQQFRLFSSTGAETTGPSTYIASNWAVNQQNRHAIAYKVNDNAVVRNGGAAATDTTSTAVTGVDMLSLGQNTSGTGNSGQLYISRFAYYPTRLSNEQLQALTV